jgi:hypothetical protein
MAVGALALKLWTLAVRTAAKPIGKQLKTTAEQSEFWRGVFMRYAQFHHRVEYQISVRLLGFKGADVKPLEPAKAVALGAEVLSEFFVFSVAGAVVILEYSRSRVADAAKKAAADAESTRKEEELQERFRAIEGSIQELSRQQETEHAAIAEAMQRFTEELARIK